MKLSIYKQLSFQYSTFPEVKSHPTTGEFAIYREGFVLANSVDISLSNQKSVKSAIIYLSSCGMHVFVEMVESYKHPDSLPTYISIIDVNAAEGKQTYKWEILKHVYGRNWFYGYIKPLWAVGLTRRISASSWDYLDVWLQNVSLQFHRFGVGPPLIRQLKHST